MVGNKILAFESILNSALNAQTNYIVSLKNRVEKLDTKIINLATIVSSLASHMVVGVKFTSVGPTKQTITFDGGDPDPVNNMFQFDPDTSGLFKLTIISNVYNGSINGHVTTTTGAATLTGESHEIRYDNGSFEVSYEIIGLYLYIYVENSGAAADYKMNWLCCIEYNNTSNQTE